MRSHRPFWTESDSTAMPDDLIRLDADDIHGRQRVIGAELRRWYDTVANEPVPDDWFELLTQGEGRSKETEFT